MPVLLKVAIDPFRFAILACCLFVLKKFRIDTITILVKIQLNRVGNKFYSGDICPVLFFTCQ